MHCPDIEELIQFARQQVSERDDAVIDHIAVCERCRYELRIINETLAADDWMMPEGSDDVGRMLREYHGDVERYIKTASKVTEDRWGRLTIAPGDRMIVDPETKECVLATHENVECFKHNGMSLYINPDSNLQSNLGAMQNRKREFGTALGTNMEALKGCIIPDYKLPWWVKLVPYPMLGDFRNCHEIKVDDNHRNKFIKHLVEHEVIPSSREVRAEVWRAIEASILFRVYELRGWGAVFHFYSIFITHIVVEEQKGIRKLSIKSSDGKIYDAVMAFVKDWKGYLKTPNCRCISIGSFGGWDDSLEVAEFPDSIHVLSSPGDKRTASWRTRHHSLEHMRPVYRTLVYRLYPETWATWYKRICDILEHEPTQNSMTVSRMAELSNVPSDCVAEVFDSLRTNDKNWKSVKKRTTGELALVRSNGYGSSDAGAFVLSHNKWLWPALLAVNFLIIVFGVGAYFLLNCIFNGIKSKDVTKIVLGVLGLLVFIAFSVLKNKVRRKIKE